MYIDTIPNRKSRPCILLRESVRDGKRVLKRTIANLTDWPGHVVEAMRASLGGESLSGKLEEAFEVIRSRAHGHVMAVLGTLRKIGLDKIIASKPCRELQLVCAMIVARIIAPCSKLATARGLDEETLSSSLGQELGIEDADEDDLYAALDWLYARQERIQKKLISKHFSGSTLVLYDVSSSYFEGKSCSLAQYGHSGDHRPDRLQIKYGLLCNDEGCPMMIEVFEGNTGDPVTFTARVKKMREQYHVKSIVWVGDRGMITSARIEEDLRGKDGFDWITALRSVEIRSLVTSGALQLSLFDRSDLAAITHPDYPGERLIACKNPLLAEERARKRVELLAATEKQLDKIVTATKRPRRPIRGKDKIALRVGKVIAQYKMAKHFTLTFTDSSFEYARNQQSIESEKNLDGIYVIRTSVQSTNLNNENTVGAYKSLSTVERAFRCLKTVDLKIRPIYHHLADRVRAHVFLCMLAYYVEWQMRQKLAPLLFDDDDQQAAQASRISVVAPARRSPRALNKALHKLTADGWPVHSFRSLLADLATIVKNTFKSTIPDAPTFNKATIPTPLQQRALDLLQLQM